MALLIRKEPGELPGRLLRLSQRQLDNLVAHRLGQTVPELPTLRRLRLQLLLPFLPALLVSAIESTARHVQLSQGARYRQGEVLELRPHLTHLSAVCLAPGVAHQALFPHLEEVLAPSIVQVRWDPLSAVQGGDAGLTPNPSSTIRTLSSAEYFLRVTRRIVRTAASTLSFFSAILLPVPLC